MTTFLDFGYIYVKFLRWKIGIRRKVIFFIKNLNIFKHIHVKSCKILNPSFDTQSLQQCVMGSSLFIHGTCFRNMSTRYKAMFLPYIRRRSRPSCLKIT